MIEDSREPDNNNLKATSNEDTPEVNEELDINSWSATGPMAELPTEMYFGNSLQPATRKQILQSEPRIKDISFIPLKMEHRMLSVMSRTDKETDRNYSKLLYRFFSVIRPIDNTLQNSDSLCFQT